MKNDWEREFIRLDDFKEWAATLDNFELHQDVALRVSFTVEGVEVRWGKLELWWKKYSLPYQNTQLTVWQGARPDTEIWVRVRWLESGTGKRPRWEGWTIEGLTFHGSGSRSPKVRDLAREYIYTLVES